MKGTAVKQHGSKRFQKLGDLEHAGSGMVESEKVFGCHFEGEWIRRTTPGFLRRERPLICRAFLSVINKCVFFLLIVNVHFISDVGIGALHYFDCGADTYWY